MIEDELQDQPLTVRVRRLHRRDLNRVWEFLKRVFREVNRETVEYQRPRTKQRFADVYEEDGIEQLLFELEIPQGEGQPPKMDIVGYAESTFQISGTDNWMNERYFARREMRPLYVEELAVSPDYQGRGIGSFIIEQLEHLARLRGCTHLVLEVAENNKNALQFYRARHFQRLDAAIFLAKKIGADDELLAPRTLTQRARQETDAKRPSQAPPRSKRASKSTTLTKALAPAKKPSKRKLSD
ncbi:MAG: GNAT family N-acetyltransferase [Deltaproteobacteria bacterium]|nr:GNAT family N-acetyltransferase [Deltaproteobacteria bacterium]